MYKSCSYKQNLKLRIIEDFGPYGTVVPMQRKNNTAKLIMRQFTNGAVRLEQVNVEMTFTEFVNVWFI